MSGQDEQENGAEAPEARQDGEFRGRIDPREASRRGREEKARRQTEWAKLDLRQEFLDEAHIVACARRAGIGVLPPRAEPASPKRLARYGRRMGILRADLPPLIGFGSYEELIAANPRVPLWALVCHIAECRELRQKGEDCEAPRVAGSSKTKRRPEAALVRQEAPTYSKVSGNPPASTSACRAM